jgi:hypothetical protein
MWKMAFFVDMNLPGQSGNDKVRLLNQPARTFRKQYDGIPWHQNHHPANMRPRW